MQESTHPPPPVPSSPAPQSAGTTSTNKRTTIKVLAAGDPRRLLALLLVSIIEFISAAKICDDTDQCEKEYGFGVAAGVISSFVCICYTVYIKMSSSTEHATLTQVVAIFMLLWWITSAYVLTFREPFTTTGNGYFAVWLCTIVSIYFAMDTVPALKRVLERSKAKATSISSPTEVVVCMFASLVELAAAATLCDKEQKCEKEEAFAVAVGSIGVATCLLVMIVPQLGVYSKFISIFLSAVWLAGVLILTFGEPFVATGNGYFSTWLAFLSSAYWCLNVFFGGDLIVTV